MAAFAITETEDYLGVTQPEVERVAARAAIIADGQKIVLDAVGPALAGAAARYRLGCEVAFLGLNQLGQPVYGRL
jgi:hypothetical protein